MFWTTEKEEALATMWRAGFTSTEIAKQFGISRNCITGKVRRMGLPNRPPALTPAKDRRPT